MRAAFPSHLIPILPFWMAEWFDAAWRGGHHPGKDVPEQRPAIESVCRRQPSGVQSITQANGVQERGTEYDENVHRLR